MCLLLFVLKNNKFILDKVEAEWQGVKVEVCIPTTIKITRIQLYSHNLQTL